MYKNIIIIVPTILWEIFTETLAFRALFHLRQALLLHGISSMIPQANWVDNEVLLAATPFKLSYRSIHV